jgi:hypothetical protein
MIATLVEITGGLIVVVIAIAGGAWVWDTLMQAWRKP